MASSGIFCRNNISFMEAHVVGMYYNNLETHATEQFIYTRTSTVE